MPIVAVVLALSALSAEPKPTDRPIPTKDAAKVMTVPEGFKVTLFAGEPEIVQPIAFTFDDRGRMWVVECLSYPNWRHDGKGNDRVVILEDTDGDGTHDKKTVFMDNGANLSGIELGFGGVWLCSSPNLLFVPILDGDKPGKPEVKLDGWNIKDTKHNIFNSLGWGPDGWLYGCNGIQAKAWVGAPGTPQNQRTYIDCGVWRYHPTRKVFGAVAHGTTNPFGLDWDEYGEMFITNCVIDHLFHIVPGGHYERMYGQDANPHVYGLMKSCVDYKHWAGGDWTSSRSTGVGGSPTHSDFGGGHAHSGCAIYLGDNFPPEYRNTLFTANIHGNRLNNDGLERTKSGMKGVRRKDFLFANDSWFRGICVKLGPEGALYVSDWCDTGECHNYDKADTTNGRIYRVSYGDPKRWNRDVSKLSDAELVKAQLSKNEWFVRNARRVLQERARAGTLKKDTVESLKTTVKVDADVPRRLRALWALAVADRLETAELIALLKEKDESLRAWAFRLMLDSGYDRTNVEDLHIEQAIEIEKSSYVRLHVAGALESEFRSSSRPAKHIRNVVPLFHRWQEADPQVVLMMWYAIEQQARREPERVGNQLQLDAPPIVARNFIRFVVDRAGPELPKLLEQVFASVEEDFKPENPQLSAAYIDSLYALRESLAGKKDLSTPPSWPQAFAKFRKSASPELLREAEALGVILGDRKLIAELQERISDTSAKAETRQAAIDLLATRPVPGLAPTLHGVLNVPVVRGAAIRALANLPDEKTPAAILKAYSTFRPEEKLDAVHTLASRAAWANALLDAIEKGTIPRSDVPVTTARQILALNDKALSARLEKVWGKITPASKERAALTKKWKEILTDGTLATADAVRGRVIFTKHCASCHKMFGEGQTVGPELTGSQRANLDYVLENVLDPSAVVPNEYRLINFTMADERLVSGIILRETKDAVTVRTTNDTVILPTADIAARKPTNVSIMPDGLIDQLKPDEVRDLIAYLRSKEQVPIPK